MTQQRLLARCARISSTRFRCLHPSPPQLPWALCSGTRAFNRTWRLEERKIPALTPEEEAIRTEILAKQERRGAKPLSQISETALLRELRKRRGAKRSREFFRREDYRGRSEDGDVKSGIRATPDDPGAPPDPNADPNSLDALADVEPSFLKSSYRKRQDKKDEFDDLFHDRDTDEILASNLYEGTRVEYQWFQREQRAAERAARTKDGEEELDKEFDEKVDKNVDEELEASKMNYSDPDIIQALIRSGKGSEVADQTNLQENHTQAEDRNEAQQELIDEPDQDPSESDLEWDRMLDEAETAIQSRSDHSTSEHVDAVEAAKGQPEDQIPTKELEEKQPAKRTFGDIERKFQQLYEDRMVRKARPGEFKYKKPEEGSIELLDEPIPSYMKNRVPTIIPFSQEARHAAEDFGFLFDCDGVLYCGHESIRESIPALRAIRWHFARYFFLTNGGGTHIESVRADALKDKLGFSKREKIFRNRVIQSHSPFAGWSKEQKENDVIYITSKAPRKARSVAEHYGFKNVVIAEDIIKHLEQIYPFQSLLANKKTKEVARPLPGGTKIFRDENATVYNELSLRAKKILKIDHIFVWNDPRDWSLETQIIHDILTSYRGYLGTQSRKNGDTTLPNNGWQQDGQPQLWVSNMDLVWKASYHLNRFGTGAFVEAFKGVWDATTGGQTLDFKFIGKPTQQTYEYAHDRLLRDYARVAKEYSIPVKRDIDPIQRVYMIGDNPESDIKGALDFKPDDGTEYIPILVRTGVWKESAHEPEPKYKPAVIVDNVLDAVAWAFRNEGINTDAIELRRSKRLMGLAENMLKGGKITKEDIERHKNERFIEPGVQKRQMKESLSFVAPVEHYHDRQRA